MNIIYFTAVPLDSDSNGGNICCRNHIRRLNEDPSINLFVVAAVTKGAEQATSKFLEKMCIENRIVVISEQNTYQEKRTFKSALTLAYKSAMQYPWEMRAINQKHIESILLWAIQHWKADWVVIDYLYSALFCEGIFMSNAKIAIITLNQESAYYKQMIDIGLINHDPFTAKISHFRLQNKEKYIYNSADQVITIGLNDNPKNLSHKKINCITPYLDLKDIRWSYSPEHANDVFFVGHYGHYPNRLAIEYIAKHLAPAISQIRKDVRFKIVGAPAVDLPPEWHHPQIDYLGFGDSSLVERLFRQSGLFICPVENEFGMKFKVAEAISYTTPTCVSLQTQKCAPYAHSIHGIDLNNHESTSNLICNLAGNEQRLKALSIGLKQEAEKFITSQVGVWSRTLANN